ncbi:MAG TPA: 2-oxoacid:acceptor oxidoreductase subunit alpha [Ignavibacteria bacterium]|nr:2-oxoacid:acceptor oxidoreductase subunit alpha [Ignavibacteria bacterium]
MEDKTQVDPESTFSRHSTKTAVKAVDDVTIRFAGDSGDGMQLTGTQFSETVAATGFDVGTLPDYPAEIRAPAGTLYGVSGFQIHFSSHEVHTAGDQVDILVAMNPAALKVNLKDLKKNGIIIANSDSFDKKNLDLAEYKTNPLEDDSLEGYLVYDIPITKQTLETLKDMKLPMKSAVKCKNFFALGVVLWLYNKSIDYTMNWISEKFAKKPDILEANKKVLKAGYYYGDVTEMFTTRFETKGAKLPAGTYRTINGNEAIALGLVAGTSRAGLNLFLGSYPITPASEVLQLLSKYKKYGVKTFQAEDEIAGVCTAIGASYAGNLGATSTSGPGMALKTEAIGLAIMAELPLVIVNVQRGGPSTGLPTKTEQADLFQAIFGRNGESPLPVLASSSPSDCFDVAVEAVRLAVKYMTPVILLSDGFIANGSEPWKVKKVSELPSFKAIFRTEPEGFFPYLRDEFLARPWVKPGTKGLENRIGGLEKQDIVGNISYAPDNHHKMVSLRAKKIKNIANDIPELEVFGDKNSKLLVLTWGSTIGSVAEAYDDLKKAGKEFAYAGLRYLNPFPKNLGKVLEKYEKILIPEVNLGQLAFLIRANYLVEPIQLNKVKGKTYHATEIVDKIEEILKTLK